MICPKVTATSTAPRLAACCVTVAFLLNVLATSVHADTAWAGLRSVEWLVDSSEVIFIGKHSADGVEVVALLKTTPECLQTHRAGQKVDVQTIDMAKRIGFKPYDDQYSRRSVQEGDRALFFLRHAPDGKPFLTKRISLDRPLSIDFDRDDRLIFFGVDRHGQPIVRASELVKLVHGRIEHGPVIPLSANRELAEVRNPLRPLRTERFGARWVYSDPLSKGDWAFDVCVPVRQQY